MYKNLGKVIEMLKKGATDKIHRELAAYLMNVYGKEDLYNKVVASEYIYVTGDLTVQLLFVEDKEICTSCNIKYFHINKDNLIFFVRKDFESCTFKEKVMVVCRMVTTILSYILPKDDVGEMTKFYAQLVYCLLAFSNDKREDIVKEITEPFAKHSQELVDDFEYISKEICKMKDEREHSSILYSLFNCGYIFKLANDAPKSEKKESDKNVKNN